MKQLSFFSAILFCFALVFFLCQSPDNSPELEDNKTSTKPPKRTRIDEAVKWRNEVTKDPATGEVPTERMFEVYRRINQLEGTTLLEKNNDDLSQFRWKERGPYNVAGRTRAILIDQSDPEGKRIFTAGVTGGLWKTEDITTNPPGWEPIGHYFDNINISAIDQDPIDHNVIYFGTGEPYGGAGRGLGIWKSTDGGENWDHLPSTVNSNFYTVVRILVYPNHDVYAATLGGLFRSTNGGVSWTKVLGSGVSGGNSNSIIDIEFASNGSLFVSSGSSNTQIFKSSFGADTGGVGQWQQISASGSGFPSGQSRVELAVPESDPNTIYALTAVGGNATGIYKSTNGGQNWFQASTAPVDDNGTNFTRGQAWYDLTIDVAPDNPNIVLVGGIDLYRSFNGGQSWVQISKWFNSDVFQYVHADQHEIQFDPERPGVVYFGNDGGIWRSENNGSNIIDRNDRYNVTQFYACAMHPEAYSNYFLAGAQDNGSQQFDKFDIDITREVLGGDGFYCHIDQNEPQYQIVSLYFGAFALSINGGQSFGGGGISIGSGFLSPSDYDDNENILYSQAANGGQYYRWPIANADGETVTISNFGSGVNHIYVSPNIPNRIYIGASGAGRIIRIDDAHTGSSKTGTIISLPIGGSVSSVAVEPGDEDHILATLSNYGVNSIWESFDGGTSWATAEGDLPDVPVNWVIFHPQNNDQAFIATDAGVWTTEDLDGSNTQWLPSLNEMPVVRTDMLQYRTSDNMILAGTYGRGLWTTDALVPPKAFMDYQRVSYIDGNTDFADASFGALSWNWVFGDGGVANGRQAVHNYSAKGIYDVSLSINSGEDVAQDNIAILPDKEVPFEPSVQGYSGDFESNTDDFAIYHVSGTSFERGNSTQNSKKGTHSGQNAWVTGVNDAFYEHNTETMLYTPNYDFSEPGIYQFSFWATHAIQLGFDGFRVEFSTDKGKTWQVLGTRGDNWYNYTNDDAGSAAFPPGSSYFTGFTTPNEYVKYRIIMEDLEGEPNVAFRFVFKTDDATRYAGLAIDDVRVDALRENLQTQIIDFNGEFISFDEVDLDWTTQPEYQSDYFEVQHSENGRDWKEKGVFDGEGFSIDPIAYNSVLENIKLPVNYFRIKAVATDSSEFFSNIIVLLREEADPDIYLVYPNPFTSTINLAFNQSIEEPIQIKMFDEIGREVYFQSTNVDGIYTQINASWLSPGTYVLQAVIGETEIVKKVLKVD